MNSFWKFLKHNKLYTFIEVVGLAFSLAFVTYVGCYTVQQYEVAKENPDCERIYMLGSQDFPGLTWGFPGKIRDQFPEIEQVAAYYPSFVAPGGGAVIEFEGRQMEVKHEVYVDLDFFRMFPGRFLMGDASVLEDPDNVIVSETFARKIFPDGNFRPVRLDEDMNLAAVVRDSDRSLFPYTDLILSEESKTSPRTYNAEFDQYGTCVPFIRVREGVELDALQIKLAEVCKEVYPMYGDNFLKELKLTRLDRLYFEKDDIFNHGDKATIWTLSTIALLLLLSAVINFVNLNSALVGQRAKEMATRRLLGSSAGSVLGRYFSESVLLTVIAMAIGLVIAVLSAPWLNSMLGSDVPVIIPFTSAYIAGYVLLVLGIGGLAAILPAFLASRYKPIDIVRGTFRKDSKNIWGKVFIVIQTSVAVIFISMALVMQLQFRKSMNREMNCNLENKYCLFYFYPHYAAPFDMEARLKELPCVVRGGRARSVPCTQTFGQYSQTMTGDEIMYRMFVMDSTTFNMLEFEILEDYGTPVEKGAWFSQTAFKATGFDSQHHDISNTLAQKNGMADHTAGVIADIPVNLKNVGVEEYSCVTVTNLDTFPISEWIIETQGDHEEAARQISALYREFAIAAQGYEFEPMYNGYLSDLKREALSESEHQMNLLYVFMLLSVIITVLGMLAMSIYDAHNRMKDIAIRKVYGSTVGEESLTGILGYMKLIALASLIGLTVSVWASSRYLQQFVVRIENYWWIFLAVILIVVLIAFLSTFWQIRKAARCNPVETLNKE